MHRADIDLIETLKTPRITSNQGHSTNKTDIVVRLVPLIILLGLAFYLMSINFGQPWVSIHEDNGLVFMSSAINNMRFGLSYTKGETIVDTETLNADSPLSIPNVPASQEFSYLLTGPIHPYIYPNHPPLLSLTVTASLLTFGFHFWAVRLVPLAFSLGAIILFYFLVGYLFDYGVAAFSTFLLISFPMMAYFGRNVGFEAAVTFWLLVILMGYAHWKRTGERRWLAIIGFGVAIGTLYDWPMVFFAVILFAVDALPFRRINGRLALVTLVPAFVTSILVLAQDFWALNYTLAPLVSILTLRSGGTGYGEAHISIITWFTQVMSWNAEGYGSWSQFVLPLAALFVVAQASQEGASLRVRLILIMFLCGLSNVLAFREGAFIHAYWQQYFLPFYAVTIGWAAVEAARRLVSNYWLRWIPLCAAAVFILAANMPTIVSLYSSRSGVFVPLLSLWR
jgi:4-amino-4-deoxy-L-arabinose transferase-like glycosyltransferase